LGGVQLLCLGIIGQYLARVYREIKSRPLFVIEKILSSDEPGGIRQPR
jgi:dolichol-phosphate mannosyltransferase